jgi:uncharacterized damage-inducible protein DinB
MSTTAQPLPNRTAMNEWLGQLVHMYQTDVRAIPADKWDATFGGCTRSARAITTEAVAILAWTAEALEGNVISGTEEDATKEWTEKCRTQESAVAQLRSVAEEFSRAFESASDDVLTKVITPPWQMDAPLYAIVQIAVNHLWYHDGQLNYIQCLLGDDKIHWMDN